MEDEDFEEQLKQEELQKLKDEDEATTGAYKDKDGIEYEWDEEKKAWFPKISEDFIAQYQMNYGSHTSESSNTACNDQQSQDYYEYYKQYYYSQQGEGESNDGDESKPKTDEKTSYESYGVPSLEGLDVNSEEYYKRYHEYYSYYYGEDYANYYNQEEVQGEIQSEGQGKTNQDNNQKGKKRKKKGDKSVPQPKREEGWFEVDQEKNTNVYVSGLPPDITDEEFQTIMNKCGLVMFDPVTKQPKLKLYLDKQGNPKGDGRCCYIKSESVDLALKILDGSDVRGSTIHVERAQFTMKGKFDPSKKKKKLSNKEKRKFQEKQKKLFDWRPEKKLEFTRPKFERVVVLKNMFDPKEFEVDPTLINDLRDDTRTECSKIGEVKIVKLFDNHPEGIITVTMKTPCEADEVIKVLNGRWFAKKKITAEAWDGKTKYEIEESEAEREKRLKKWENFISEADDKKDSNESLTNQSSVSTDSQPNTSANSTDQSEKENGTIGKGDNCDEKSVVSEENESDKNG